MEMETIPDNLQGLKWNKLQSLCKKFGVPANLKVSSGVSILNHSTLHKHYAFSSSVISACFSSATHFNSVLMKN